MAWFGFLAFALLQGITAAETSASLANTTRYIQTIAEYRTECKTCPRSLCTNQLYYEYDEVFNVTCWNHGTKIMGDEYFSLDFAARYSNADNRVSLWLKSAAGCYVTQYDVIEYNGDCMHLLHLVSLSCS